MQHNVWLRLVKIRSRRFNGVHDVVKQQHVAYRIPHATDDKKLAFLFLRFGRLVGLWHGLKSDGTGL